MALETTQALADEDATSKDLAALLAPIAARIDGLVGRGDGTEADTCCACATCWPHGLLGQARARVLADCWQPRLTELLNALSPLGALPLLTRSADGQVLRVLGEMGRLEVVPELSAALIGTEPGAAAIRFGERLIPLAPFVIHGLPRAGEIVGRSEVAQIFMRRSEISLEYMALGSEDTAFGLGMLTSRPRSNGCLPQHRHASTVSRPPSGMMPPIASGVWRRLRRYGAPSKRPADRH